MSSEQRLLSFKRILCGVTPASVPPDVAPAGGPEDRKAGPQDAQHEQARREEEMLRRKKAELDRKVMEMAQSQKVLDDRIATLAQLIGEVKRKKVELLEESEETIVALCLSITEKVLQHEIEEGRYKIGEIVKGAMEAVRANGKITVRVNPKDLSLAQAAVKKLCETTEHSEIVAVADESVPLAACCIETESGRIFSDVAGRFERIERSLLRKGKEPNGV